MSDQREVCGLEYRHGGDIYGADEIWLDFSVNTNPFGMPERIRQAVIASSESWERYPDCLCRKLKKGLADYYGAEGGRWEAGDFICGNGASDLFYTMALALRPRRALLAAPSFGEYERALRLSGCGIEWYALNEAQGFSPEAETDAFFSFVERADGLSLVLLGNPNNPNGLAVSAAWVSRLADVCREKGAVLAVDECFNWFVPERERYSVTALMGREEERFAHVLVFQAFTKIYAMPGLRAGCVRICGGSESADAGKTGVGSDWYGGGRCAGCGRKAAAYAACAAGGCFAADSIRAALPQSAVSGGAGRAVQRADGLPGASRGSGRRGGAAGGPERREGVGPVADLCGLSGKAPQRR